MLDIPMYGHPSWESGAKGTDLAITYRRLKSALEVGHDKGGAMAPFPSGLSFRVIGKASSGDERLRRWLE
jgi:hypothetical protein